jgi:hypothetical protein
LRFRICPICGAHLDPGERCDCKDTAAEREANTNESGEVLCAANMKGQFAPYAAERAI